MGDAQALKGEEGRGKLRKVSGRRKQPQNAKSPNGATLNIPQGRQTWGTETSKYPQEKKTIVIP